MLSLCRGRHIPPYVAYRAEVPPSIAEEIEDVAHRAASKRNLHLATGFNHGGGDSSDGLPTLSLWMLPTEKDTALWIMTLHRVGTTLTVAAFDHAGLTPEELDPLIAEVHAALENELGLALCDVRLAAGSVCVRPAEPRLLYLMALDHAAEEPGLFLYDLAARHGVRTLEIKLPKTETPDDGDVEELFTAYFYSDVRSFHRGAFPVLVTNAPSGSRLALSVFDRGEMHADTQDALVQDAKSTFEAHYGGRFCRASAATERCDKEHAKLERQREAWLQARATGDAAAIEAFLAAWPENPHAHAARGRVARLRDLDKHPPPAPAGPTTPWAGRSPGESFTDTLPDGSLGPRMTVAPAGVFRMGCSDARGCPLEELPVHEVRVARPFALSTREVTYAEYYRFARPEKRLDPTWSDRPATHLTWADAAAYAAWLAERTGAAYRLPSEAEWEWAARAGAATAYAWGDEMEGGRARCHECPWPQPTGRNMWGDRMNMPWVLPVASYPANGWGFHDMHGNAAEWTADCWHRDHVGAPPDGLPRADGDCSRRVVRGGSYDTPAHALRSSARVGKVAGDRYLDVGFRVLRELRNVEARAE